jgi:plastocyanin
MPETTRGLSLRDPELQTRGLALAIVLLFVSAILAVTLLPGTTAQAATAHVSIKNFSFNPPDVTIPSGSSVVWSNDETDGTEHSVTSDDGTFTADLMPGDTFSQSFANPGTYGVHCRFHTYITGTITVGGGDSTTTTTTAPASTTSTTAPSTTSTTAPESTTTTTTPGSTTTTTAPGSTTTTTAPESTTTTTTPGSTPSTTAPQDDTIIGGTIIPPVDGAISDLFAAIHDALAFLADSLAGAS